MSVEGDLRAQSLLEVSLPPLQRLLELWSNGGPEYTATEDEEALLESEDKDNDAETKDNENEIVVMLEEGLSQFNTILIELDNAAQQLATKYFRTFGSKFVKRLQHGNAAADYHPAIQSSSDPIPTIKFGTKRKGKPTMAASDVSKNREPRSRAREYMLGRYDNVVKGISQLTDAIDEVNQRPSIRKYKEAASNEVEPITGNLDEVLVSIEEDISNRENQLHALYMRRAQLQQSRNVRLNLPGITAPPATKAIVLIAGPHAHYDSITMFGIKENIPQCDPLQGFFQAMYSIRETTAPDTTISSMTSSGVETLRKKSRHEINTSASIAASKV